jgi:L-asparaginase II
MSERDTELPEGCQASADATLRAGAKARGADAKSASANPVLVDVLRGEAVESRHRGAAVVVDSRGRRLAAWGDADAMVFPRSAVKPLQALPLVESGAADRFGVDGVELALACASHGGEAEHVERVRRWLARLGCGEDDLICGAHPPLNEAAADALLRAGRQPSRLHDNCSGKHAGFLTLALHLGAPIARYGEPGHPVQRRVRRVLAEMGEADLTAAPVAVDGCGVPTFALPLAALARAFAALAEPARLAAGRSRAVGRLAEAMTVNPWFVGGTGRFDTAVMQQAAGAVLVKSGAEGVAAAALPGLRLGIAVKIDDGGKRACDAAMAALLLRFAAPTGPLGDALEGLRDAPVRNTLGAVVGLVKPADGWPE